MFNYLYTIILYSQNYTAPRVLASFLLYIVKHKYMLLLTA